MNVRKRLLIPLLCLGLLAASLGASCALGGQDAPSTPNPTFSHIEEGAVYEAVAQEYISLRATADAGGALLEKMDAGETMICLGFEGVFMRVKAERSGREGYVHGGYVRRVDAPASVSGALVPLSGERYTYAHMKDDIGALAQRYQGFLTVQSLGRTADGRDIALCILGSEQAAHKVLVTAAIHGREHMTALLAMHLVEQTLYEMQVGAAEYTDVAFYVLPMLNPDGVTISQLGATGIDHEPLRADVERILSAEGTEDSMWKANANGVDLNRNFPSGWDTLYAQGPASARYRGASPLCEDETKAIELLMETVRFDATVSYHSTGSLQYWQYGQQGDLLARTETLARALYEATGYPLASSETEEYLEGGGLRDWALAQWGIPSVTVEIGCLPSPLLPQEFGGILQRNRDVFRTLASFVKGPN